MNKKLIAKTVFQKKYVLHFAKIRGFNPVLVCASQKCGLALTL